MPPSPLVAITKNHPLSAERQRACSETRYTARDYSSRKRDDRVEPSRAPSRNVAREKRDCREEQRDAEQREWIRGRDVVEHSRHDTGQRERAEQPDGDADARERGTVRQHELQHFARMCAEREAHGELARALRDHRRHHSEDPNRRKCQRDHREDAEQRGAEALARERSRENRSHGTDGADRLIGIQSGELARQRCRNVGGVVASAHEQREPGIRRLMMRQVDRRSRLLVERGAMDVANHAHDLTKRVAVVSHGDSLAQCALAGPVPLGKGLVHDQDRAASNLPARRRGALP